MAECIHRLEREDNEDLGGTGCLTGAGGRYGRARDGCIRGEGRISGTDRRRAVEGQRTPDPRKKEDGGRRIPEGLSDGGRNDFEKFLKIYEESVFSRFFIYNS